ncbi:MAG: deaminase [bacterium]|nr:deaminase [bacterium]
MPGANLIAYIPTLNQRHLEWFKRYPDSDLFLISQGEAEQLLPRLARNMAALPTEVVARTISLEGWVRRAQIFLPGWEDSDPDLSSPTWKSWVLPDEDVSHMFAEKYLEPAGCSFSFEMIWARYDMIAVTRNQPVIPDVQISSAEFDQEFMRRAIEISEQSPDWWRTIGALAVSSSGQALAVACNTHMPNEYETYLFGDPGLNRDAGQEGKYTSIHAEEAVITHCARYGLALEGSHLYVNTFPCERCARQLVQAGVNKIFFRDGFSSLNAQDVFRVNSVKIIQVKSPEA